MNSCSSTQPAPDQYFHWWSTYLSEPNGCHGCDGVCIFFSAAIMSAWVRGAPTEPTPIWASRLVMSWLALAFHSSTIIVLFRDANSPVFHSSPSSACCPSSTKSAPNDTLPPDWSVNSLPALSFSTSADTVIGGGDETGLSQTSTGLASKTDT